MPSLVLAAVEGYCWHLLSTTTTTTAPHTHYDRPSDKKYKANNVPRIFIHPPSWPPPLEHEGRGDDGSDDGDGERSRGGLLSSLSSSHPPLPQRLQQQPPQPPPPSPEYPAHAYSSTTTTTNTITTTTANHHFNPRTIRLPPHATEPPRKILTFEQWVEKNLRVFREIIEVEAQGMRHEGDGGKDGEGDGGNMGVEMIIKSSGVLQGKRGT